MKLLSAITVTLTSVMLLACCYTRENQFSDLPSGLYEFHYVSFFIEGNKISDGNWKKPTHLNHNDQVTYKVVTDDLIYRGYNNKQGKLFWSDTLIRVPAKELLKYDPVPNKILDFNLVGVYYPDRRFTDTFAVLYYSKNRNSIIHQLHVYALHRMEHIAIYMNKPYHPFYDFDKYFKMPSKKDSVYNAPVQEMKEN